MNNKVLISLVLYISSFGSMALESGLLPITYSNTNSDFLLSGFASNMDGGVVLNLSNIKKPTTPEQLLEKYYWLLKNAKFHDAAKLYSVDGGSRTKFIDALESQKLDLNGFSQLSESKVVNIQRWGAFVYLLVEFKNHSGKKITLREKLICKPECKIIYDPIIRNDEVTKLLSDNEAGYRTLKGQQYRIPSEQELIHFTKLTLPHPDETGDKFPMSFYLNINNAYSGNFVERKKDCSGNYKVSVEVAFCNFLSKTGSFDVSDSALLSTFMDSLTGFPGLGGVNVNEFSGKNISRVFYSDNAFISWVGKWSGVELIGSVENNYTYFLLFKPILTDGRVYPVQVVTFDKLEDPNYSAVIYGSNWEDTYSYFYNSLFVKELTKVIYE